MSDMLRVLLHGRASVHSLMANVNDYDSQLEARGGATETHAGATETKVDATENHAEAICLWPRP